MILVILNKQQELHLHLSNVGLLFAFSNRLLIDCGSASDRIIGFVNCYQLLPSVEPKCNNAVATPYTVFSLGRIQ